MHFDRLSANGMGFSASLYSSPTWTFMARHGHGCFRVRACGSGFEGHKKHALHTDQAATDTLT